MGMSGAAADFSSFHTPKVTVELAPTDDILMYCFWAAAQKPSGLSALAAGASATTIEQLRFEPERLDAREFGVLPPPRSFGVRVTLRF